MLCEEVIGRLACSLVHNQELLLVRTCLGTESQHAKRLEIWMLAVMAGMDFSQEKQLLGWDVLT